MLLALDAGNSNITIGAFEGRDLVFQWRLRTVHEQTADEWGHLRHGKEKKSQQYPSGILVVVEGKE